MSGDRWAYPPVTEGIVTRDHLITQGVGPKPETWKVGTETTLPTAPDTDECERCDRADDVIDRVDYYITALIHEPALTEREAGIVHALADILQDRP